MRSQIMVTRFRNAVVAAATSVVVVVASLALTAPAARADDSAGAADRGPLGAISPESVTPPGPPRSFRIWGVDREAHDISLQWDTADSPDVEISGYVVQYRTPDSGDEWMDATTRFAGLSATVDDGEGFQFRVAATYDDGGSLGDFAGPLDSPTLAGAPTDVVASVDPARPWAVELTWTAPADGGLPIDDYTVQYRSFDGTSYGDWQDPPGLGITGTAASISGLGAGSSYSFRVRANTGRGEGPFSDPSNDVATAAAVPDAPADLLVRQVGDRTVTLSWTAPPGNGADVSAYSVSYWPTDDPSDVRSWATDTETVQQSPDLVPDVEYAFSVQAENSAGLSSPSPTVTATPSIYAQIDDPSFLACVDIALGKSDLAYRPTHEELDALRSPLNCDYDDVLAGRGLDPIENVDGIQDLNGIPAGDFGGNDITDFIVPWAPDLTRLVLDGNPLEAIVWPYQGSGIQELSLGGTDLPVAQYAALPQLDSLNVLDISDDDLGEKLSGDTPWPFDFYDMWSLTDLDLSGNGLTDDQLEDQLSSISWLGAHGPDKDGGLPFTTLRLDDNQLTALGPIPDTVTDLRLAGNRIEDADFSPYRALRDLDLSRNRIARIPWSLDDMLSDPVFAGSLTLDMSDQEIALPEVSPGDSTENPVRRPDDQRIAVVQTNAGAPVLQTDALPENLVWQGAGVGTAAWGPVDLASMYDGDGLGVWSGTLTQDVAVPSPSAGVTDPGFQACIYRALFPSLPPDPGYVVTQADMAGLGILTCSDDGISDVGGLQYATSLTALDLAGNDLTAVDVPDTLTALTDLELQGNAALTEVTIPGELTLLETLDIEDTGVTAVAIPDELTAFAYLYAEGSRLAALSLPSDLSSLRKLYVAGLHLAALPDLSTATGIVELTADGQTVTGDATTEGATATNPVAYAGTPLALTAVAPAALMMADDGGTYWWTTPADGTATQTASWTQPLPAGATFSGTLTTEVTASEPAGVADTALAECIDTALGLPADHVPTREDLQRLTELDCEGAAITDVTGLEHATNLTLLWLPGNLLGDVSIPATLTRLEDLNLSGNGLTSIALPDGLTALSTLTLADNLLTSLAIPDGYEALGSLDVSDNRFTALPSLPGDVIGGLQQLRAAVNPLPSSIALPEAMTGLESLDLHGTGIDDLTIPATITRLTRVDLDENLFATAPDLSAQDGLTYLDLGWNRLTAAPDLGSFTGLEYLDLSVNRLLSSPDLTGLDALTELYLGGQEVTMADSADVGAAQDNPVEVSGAPVPLAAGEDGPGLVMGPDDATYTWTGAGEGTAVWSLEISAGGTTATFDGSLHQTVTSPSAGITDPGLLACVNRFLDEPEDHVPTQADVGGINDLDCHGYGVRDLVGLEYATTMTWLNLSGNGLTTVSVPDTLIALTDLNLSGNELTEVSIPAGLAALDTLDLSDNLLDAFPSFPDEITGDLRQLRLAGNDLGSVALPDGMTALESLDLRGSGLEHLSIPGTTTRLESLDLSGNALVAMPGLSGQAGLTYLDLSFNALASADGVEDLTALEHLDLSSNRVASLPDLSGLTGLAFLSLSGQSVAVSEDATVGVAEDNPVGSAGAALPLSAADGSPTLEMGEDDATYTWTQPGDGTALWSVEVVAGTATATFDGSLAQTAISPSAQITDPGLLACVDRALDRDPGYDPTQADVAGLDELDCTDADPAVRNLEGLQYAGALERLALGGDGLSSLTFPSGLTSLTRLDLSRNAFVAPPDMSALSALGELILTDNALTTIDGPHSLADLTTLVTLRLSGNRLTSLPDLGALTGLRALSLDRNCFAVVPDLSANTLDDLSLGDQRVALDPVAEGAAVLNPVALADETPVALASDREPSVRMNAGDASFTWSGTGEGTAAWSVDVTAGGVLTTFAGALTQSVTAPADILYTATPYSGVYDGSAHSIAVDVTAPASGAMVMYGLVPGTYDLSVDPSFADAGTTTVYFRITAPGYVTATGSSTVTIARASRPAPAAPTMASHTTTSVTLGAVTGAEYSVDDGTSWQADPTFAGLAPGTSYAFVQRLAATANQDASAASAATTIGTVGIPPAWATAPGALPGATVGSPYSVTVQATGIPAPTYTVTAGALPAGTGLTAGGVFSGVPTAAGTYAFTVTAANTAGASTIDLSIVVMATQPVISGGDGTGPLDPSAGDVVTTGSVLTITGSGYQPFVPLTLELHSDPVFIAAVTTDATGSFAYDWRVPAGIPAGEHHVYILDARGSVVGVSPLTVVAPRAADAGRLPATGVDASAVNALALTALGLLLAGLAILTRRRRIRSGGRLEG